MKSANNKSFGRGGTAFSDSERKTIRKGFTAVSMTDHLAVYIDGIKIDPASWDRFGDKNRRSGKDGKAFNLKWIKNGGSKLDQIAQAVQSVVTGYSNVDESDIILEIVSLIDLYPAGMTEYYFDATNANEAEANYYKMKENTEPGNDDINISELSDKEFAEYMKIKPGKTKRVTGRLGVHYTKELALIKRLNGYNGNRTTVNQLKLVCNLATQLLKNKNCGHKTIIKKIQTRLTTALKKLQSNKVTVIKKLEVKNDLFKILEKPLHNPKVKAVTLGTIDKGATAPKKKVPGKIGTMKPF